MSTRQALPALPPSLKAKCEGCDVPYRRVERGIRGARIIVRHRLKFVVVGRELARLCDACRKLLREHGELPA